MFLNPFDAPDPRCHRYQNAAWKETAPDGIAHPDFLWRDYWQRFNTMRIPLFDEDEYYDIAIAIAKSSRDQQEFETRFAEANRQQRKRLLSMMRHARAEAQKNARTFSSNKAWLTAIYASETGCLQYFVRLLEGVVSGSEAVVVGSDTEHEAPLYRDADGSVIDKSQSPVEEGAGGVDAGVHAHEHSSCYPYMNGPMPRHWDQTQHLDDFESDYETRSEYDAKDKAPAGGFAFTGTYAEYMASRSDGTPHEAPGSDSQAPSARQLRSPIANGRCISNEAVDKEVSQDTPANPPRHDGDTTPAKRKVRLDDVDDAAAQKPKRRKLKHDAAPTSTRQASRKRSRSDDDSEDNGYKRQKMESLPSPPTSHTSSAELGEDTTTVEMPSTSPSNASRHNEPRDPTKSLENSGADTADVKRKRRKEGSVSRTTRAKASQTPQNCRSSRRSKSSPLWELDSSGKPQSVS